MERFPSLVTSSYHLAKDISSFYGLHLYKEISQLQQKQKQKTKVNKQSNKARPTLLRNLFYAYLFQPPLMIIQDKYKKELGQFANCSKVVCLK